MTKSTKIKKHQHKKISQLVVFSILFFASFALMSHTFQYDDHQIIIKSKLWSDFAAHIPLIRSFSMGNNFPPEYPTFPGEPIRYHYLFYLSIGLLEKSGLNIAFATNILSAVGFATLLFMIFKITHLVYKSYKASILAILLFLFNGSLSFINFFTKNPINSNTLSDIIQNKEFASFGPWDESIVSAFWNLNIYTNQRHLGLGFGLLLIALWPIFTYLYRSKKISTIQILSTSIILLLLPLIHQAAFVSLIVVLFMMSIYLLRQKNCRKFILFSFIATLPGIIHAINLQSGSIEYSIGFLSQSQHLLDIIWYWINNLGAYLVLIPILFYKTIRNNKLILLSFTPLFILANIFRFTPDMINNHKLINIFMIIAVIYISGWLVKLYNQSNIHKVLIPALIVLLTFSGFIDLFPIINDYGLKLDDIPKSDILGWIHTHTPPSGIFLVSSHIYNPASIAGRKTWLDYGYFNWSLGYNDAVRKEKLPIMFSSTNSMNKICSLLLQNNIAYVYVDSDNGDIPDIDPHLSTIVTENDPVFVSKDKHEVYEVKELCPQ